MPKYIAKQSVGHFRPGQEIEGLEDKQLQALLTSGAIEEYKALEQTPSDDSSDELEKLKGEVADLTATNKQLIEEKDKAIGEVADLKSKVTKLEADLAAAVAKTPKAEKAADKGATDTK
ncbi:hypothetical protein [Acinetobacter sp. Ac_5812]|uniref:hypothetical protein n=1 Tax=Acinetobacter sp. Ac_5812 TaxID=1848937 RepID=UPI00148F8B25|nr:hypothetical protein [Acinetobacter sp. Ac_5812]NNP71258.1 hypothetical protein [Acinetobacter sp. Ac_5812]